MRQNPRWILLSEVRSAEAVMSVRNSISSGHCILSTIHSDRAANIPMRMYSLLESNLDIDQFLKSIHRYVQLGIHVKGYMSPELQRFQREIVEVCEFYVDDNNEAKTNVIFRKNIDGTMTYNNPTKYLRANLGAQGIMIKDNLFVEKNQNDEVFDNTKVSSNTINTSATINRNINSEVLTPNVGVNASVQVNQPSVNPSPVNRVNIADAIRASQNALNSINQNNMGVNNATPTTNQNIIEEL